jgi:hypothetical protein
MPRASTKTPAAPEKSVRPDSKGRVALGALAKDVSSFDVEIRSDGVLLKPKMEVPASEAWLFKNAAALASVRQGLKESAEGKRVKGPSYAKHAEDPDEG